MAHSLLAGGKRLRPLLVLHAAQALQPEWSKRDKMMPLVVNYILQNPKWKVSLQTHKYLNIP